jgi:hypothetical protein
MVATNSGLWYAGDKPVVAAYNKGEQVYPLTTDPEPPVDKTYNIWRSAVGVFDMDKTWASGFAHYNTAPSGQLSGYRYSTMFQHTYEDGSTSGYSGSYFPERNIGWNFWDHMQPDGSGANPGYEAVNCYRTRKTNPSAGDWYYYSDFFWTLTDRSKTPQYLIDLLNLDFSFTTTPSFISSSSQYHCYPYDQLHLHGVPNRTLTVDDVVNCRLTQKDYLGYGAAWDPVAGTKIRDIAATQIAWVQVPSDAFTWTVVNSGAVTGAPEIVTFMISVWGDGNDLEAPENPRGEYPLPA